MNKIIMAAFLFLLGCICLRAESGLPSMESGYITDKAGVISEADAVLIREMLYDFEKKTGSQITVLTVNSVSEHGRYLWLSDFASDVYEKWGIGNRKYDNGILLVVAVSDRTINFHMGAAFKGAYTKKLGAITEKRMLPYFRKGDVSRGIFEGLRELTFVISGEKKDIDLRVFVPYLLGLVLLFMAAFTVRYISIPKFSVKKKEEKERTHDEPRDTNFGRAGIASF